MNDQPTTSYEWSRIQDLPSEPATLEYSELRQLSGIWEEQREELHEIDAVEQFNQRLLRRWAIETGIIERLYSLDKGITQLLVERGLDASFIPHSATDKSPEKVMQLIRDQHDAAEGLFTFVSDKRELSTSYIKELHAALTKHQDTTEAVDPTGKLIEVTLIKGEYKKRPNNPIRPDGTIHEYCPPEHVASEMNRLIQMHYEHQEEGVAPEVEAAWLHHRFTQIHPFQDGNGRVARALATLIFLKANWLPLVITDEIRGDYIGALEVADKGDLSPLVRLFGKTEKKAFMQALSVVEEVRELDRNLSTVVAAIRDTFEKRDENLKEEYAKAKEYAGSLREDAIDFLDDISNTLGRDLAPHVPRGKEFESFVDEGVAGSERDHWFKYQIIEVAKELEYFANMSIHHDWARLGIDMDGRSDILISIHGVGKEFRGLLAATACFYRRDDSDGTDTTISDVKALCDEALSINYHESLPEVRTRFQRWIEPVLVKGLEVFRRGL